MEDTLERWWTVTIRVVFIDPNDSPIDENPGVIDPLERLTAWAEVRGGSCLTYTQPDDAGAWFFQLSPGEAGSQEPTPDLENAWLEQVRQALDPPRAIREATAFWEPGT